MTRKPTIDSAPDVQDDICRTADEIKQQIRSINASASADVIKSTGIIEKLTEHLKELAQTSLQVSEKDVLTGVRNRNSYEFRVANLDRLIAEGMAPEFGILLCDIDGLKHVNDTLGHDAGDQLIIAVCRIICRVFEHSPVFRIGGDEFAVLLTGSDYANRGRLTASLGLESDKSKCCGYPFRISFSCGIAVFISDLDTSSCSVLARADRRMYAEKRKKEGVIRHDQKICSVGI